MNESNIVFKRKFRWTFEAKWGEVVVPPCFVKMSHDKDKKQFTTTHYDVDATCEEMAPIYKILARVYEKPEVCNDITASVVMYDGCGRVMEKWHFGGVFPVSVNFGDLDFNSSGSVTIETTWIYNSLEFEDVWGDEEKKRQEGKKLADKNIQEEIQEWDRLV